MRMEQQKDGIAGGSIPAPVFIRGELGEGSDSVQCSLDLGVDFSTPKIELDRNPE